MVVPVVVDTNVFIAALRSGGGASREVLRGCLKGAYEPLFASALITEYEHAASALSSIAPADALAMADALAAVGRWVNVYFLWRPNLWDEADNHLVELAVAGGAKVIVTHNIRHLRGGELLFPSIRVLTPSAFLKEFPCPP